MTRRAQLVVVRLLSLAAAAFALLPRPASAWWETTVTTNSQAMTSQSYITNGLVAMWDGVENAGVGTHDATATSWKDLVGGMGDFVFVGTPTIKPNSIYFDGSSYGRTGVSKILSASATIEIVCKMYVSGSSILSANQTSTKTSGEYGIIAPFDYGSSTHKGELYYSMSQKPNDSSVYADFSILETVSICWTIGASQWKTYVNGSLYSVVENANAHSFAVSELLCAKYFGLSNAYQCEISRIGLRDSVLTDEQVVTNYAVDKQRFIDGWGNNPVVTTNRVYRANPPASAYDALSPWNAPERTRLGGDARTLRPSAIIKEN